MSQNSAEDPATVTIQISVVKTHSQSSPDSAACKPSVSIRGPLLTNNFPGDNFCRQYSANMPCLVWFPQGIPAGRSLLIASSRIGRKVDELDEWFDALRTLACRLNPEEHFFLTAAGTTTDRFVRHLALRFGFPILELKAWTPAATVEVEQFLHQSVPNERFEDERFADQRFADTSLEDYPPGSVASAEEPEPLFSAQLTGMELTSTGTAPAAETNSPILSAYFLPVGQPLNGLPTLEQFRRAIGQAAAEVDPDSVLLQIASEVYLLAVRRRGNIHHAALERLARFSDDHKTAEPNVCSERTWVLISRFTKLSLQQELESAGAIGWWLYEDDLASDLDRENRIEHPIEGASKFPSARDSESRQVPNAPQRPGAWPGMRLEHKVPSVLSLDEFPAENFLIHWTRDRCGPWPGQTESEWLDDLLFQRDRRKHGAADALRRILATRQILASRTLTRDHQPVVCFSNRRLVELKELNIFRQHLGRWDFVPFGVAIDRAWLSEQGARPVIYGSEEQWSGFSEIDRPFFQLAKSKSGKFDWTIEQEWRWLGNLNLRKLPHSCVVAFVPSKLDVQSISDVCSWPIVVLNSASP